MVAIKDMEMPNNCIECKLCHFFFDLNGVTHFICKCGNMEMCGNIENKRNDLCPLIEVDKTEIYKDCFQPKTKTGHWIFEGNQCFSCSSCGRIYTQKIFEYLKLHKYDSDFPNNCPNCGKRMIEPKESEDK